MTSCPDLTAVALPSNLSDHTLILIQVKPCCRIDKKPPFRYVNTWCNHHGYVDCINSGFTATVWGGYQYNLIATPKQTKTSLKEWSRQFKQQDLVTKLQNDYHKWFLLADDDPKNINIYNNLMNINVQLMQANKLQTETLM